MRGLGVAGETWAIPGSSFLLLYAAGGLVVLVLSVRWRGAMTAGPTGTAVTQPHPFEVAYLAGGPLLATTSALAALRSAGAVDATDRGLLQITGPMPAGGKDLDHAIYSAAEGRVAQRDLIGDPGVARALDRMRAGLIRSGWLLSDQTRRRARLAALPVLAWLAFGGAGLVAAVHNGRPVGHLVMVLAGPAIVTLVLLTVPRTSRAAGRTVGGLRRTHAHLSPKRSPSWALYGPGGAALGVALFGTAAFWATDPVFADRAEIARHAANSGSTDGGGGDGGCGGGCGGCGG
jgi:uncharacterized protein (TIGR04222 family)